jgi:hypothetical protein
VALLDGHEIGDGLIARAARAARWSSCYGSETTTHLISGSDWNRVGLAVEEFLRGCERDTQSQIVVPSAETSTRPTAPIPPRPPVAVPHLQIPERQARRH